MRIGIGITTYNRPECLKECLEHIHKHTFMENITLYIATDTNEDRRGVAFRKNECLRALKDCDFVFLLDDDTFPVKDGWVDYFVNSDEEHLLFLNRKLHGDYSVQGDRKVFLNCGGVFMFMTKKAIEKVGAFDEKFELFGFEHADYSIRIIGHKHSYPMLKYTEQYLFSHDYSTLNHKSSMSKEDRDKCVKLNWDKFFKEPIKQYISL